MNLTPFKSILTLMLIVCSLIGCDNAINKPNHLDEQQNAQFKLSFKSNSSQLKSAKSYELSHATLIASEVDEPGLSAVYQANIATDNNLSFDLPTEKEVQLVELNVYDNNNELVLIQDEDEIGKILNPIKDPIRIDIPQKEDPILIEVTEPIKGVYFNWEVATYVNNDSKFPRLPWISGASTGVRRTLSLDHKKEDGWELVHNSFVLEKGNNEPRNKYLLFYNKFTGILRMWYWHEDENAHSQLNYSIQSVAETSLFNFNGDFAYPMNSRRPAYSQYISGSGTTPSSQGISKDNWYMFEYEMAYDENVKNIPLEKSDLLIASKGIDISDIELNGSQSGTINGSIVINSKSANLMNLGNFSINNNDKTTNTVNNETSSVVTNDASDWWSQIEETLSEQTAKSIGNAGGKLSGSFLNLITNPVGNFLNSLVHQGLGQTGAVNLKMNTNISLSGTVTTAVPVATINLHIPTSQNNTLEYLYGRPLGVFNIDKQPAVKYQQTYFDVNGPHPRYFQYFEIDRGSFDFVINPAIINQVTIVTKKSELYFYKRYEGGTKLERFEMFGEAKPFSI